MHLLTVMCLNGESCFSQKVTANKGLEKTLRRQNHVLRENSIFIVYFRM